MLTVTLDFQNELGQVVRRLAAPTSIKDLIESLGVPHCEIGPVFSRRSGESLALESLTIEGDVLEVHPAGPRRLPDPRFLCDGHLGKLARLLRVMGFDTAWDDSWSEAAMARRGLNENRTVLSRSLALLKRAAMDDAMLIRSDHPDEQAAEVLRRFLLTDQINLFGRCSRCNGLLREVPKSEVTARIPPRTAKWLDTYYLCRECDQLYWEGTHVAALRRRVEPIIARACGPDPSETP